VSTCSKRSRVTCRRSALTIAVGCVAWWSSNLSTPAQESESPALVACLSLSTIQPEPILSNIREPPARPAPRVPEHADWPIPELHRKPTDAEAWESFEEEYKPSQETTSPVKHQIESAKYGLDTTLFAVDRFVKSIRDHADFEFVEGNLRHTQENSRGGMLANPRVNLDLDMLRTKPYIGVRLVIPFGN